MDKLSNKYIDEIVSWNKKFNLTGLKTADDIRTKLYNDCLNIEKAIDLRKPIKVIDIGCGAGLPGIPLKIEYPNITLTLVDSVAKKINFVRHVIAELQLSGTEALCERAEVLGHNEAYREQYDLAVSRAVAQLNVLMEYCLPFVKIGGLFVASKGPDIEAEISQAKSAIAQLGGKLKEKVPVASGNLVIIEKIKATPEYLPRETGLPSKNPL